MQLYWSNEPSVVRHAGVRALWGLAVLASVPGAVVTIAIAHEALQWHRMPRLHSGAVIGFFVLLVPPVLAGLAAEGLRRATRWAVGLAMTVTIGAGALSVFVALMIVTHMAPYDDVWRKQVAATIGLAALAGGMFKLAAGVARCGPYLEELRGRTVRAFEPVMTPVRPDCEPGGGPERQ